MNFSRVAGTAGTENVKNDAMTNAWPDIGKFRDARRTSPRLPLRRPEPSPAANSTRPFDRSPCGAIPVDMTALGNDQRSRTAECLLGEIRVKNGVVRLEREANA